MKQEAKEVKSKAENDDKVMRKGTRGRDEEK